MEIVMKGLQHTNAFVIQFRGLIEAGEKRNPGRVEHEASGRTAIFQSIDELPEILLGMLKSALSDEVSGMG